MHRFLTVISLGCLIILSCGSTEKEQKSAGQSLYDRQCVLCHGPNGKLSLNGSKDLTLSPLTLDERITIITYGKGTMTPYKNILSPEEIQSVAEYTFTLKEKQ